MGIRPIAIALLATTSLAVPVAASGHQASGPVAYELELGIAYGIAAEDARRRAEPAPAGSDAAPGSVDAATPPLEPDVELEAHATIRFIGDDGERVLALGVVPCAIMRIRIHNTAGFEHPSYIGTAEELRGPRATTEAGIASWPSGVRELTWEVLLDPTGLLCGCTVPGHLPTMHGAIVVADG